MNHFSQIQTLKAKIDCSTKDALALLKNSDNDIERAINLYHQQNIQAIIEKTHCDDELAHKCYQFFQHNSQKAIEKIQELQYHDVFIHQIITTRDDKRRYREAGFEIYIKSKDKDYWHDHVEDHIFIPMKDVWLIEPIFSKHCNDFDYTFYNQYNHQAILAVIDELALLKDGDKAVMAFYQEVIDWLKQKSKPDNIIEIYGNI